MKRHRVSLGLSPHPPLLEVKQEEEETEPQKDLSFAPEASSAASSSGISTTVLTSTSDYDLSKGLAPGRVEGQFRLVKYYNLARLSNNKKSVWNGVASPILVGKIQLKCNFIYTP